MTPIQRAQADMAFQMLLARIFGQRYEGSENGVSVVAYRWRGKFFVTEVNRNLDI